jgi:CheY-like chemotaxis protein
MLASHLFPIFVVEDSDDDLFLFRRLLSKAAVSNQVDVATNGQAAIDDLKRIGELGPSETPRLIFLDLKLPLRSGFEVLEWIRSQPAFRGTAVLVLSSSAEARDVKRAFDLGAHGYLVKYPAPSVFQDIIRLVSDHPSSASFDGVEFPGVARPASN